MIERLDKLEERMSQSEATDVQQDRRLDANLDLSNAIVAEHESLKEHYNDHLNSLHGTQR